jgi:hypothetical protein
MRKQAVFALFAVFALSAILAAPAFAESELPEWIVGGSEVTSPTAVETKESITLTDLKTLAGETSIRCEDTLDGTVGPEGKDEVTALLNTAGEKIGEKLSGLALLCTAVKGCEGTSEVWPIGLPWKTQLEVTGTELLDDTTSSTAFGYEAKCTVLGVVVSDECTQTLSVPLLENMLTGETPDLLVHFSEVSTANCTLGGEKSGDISGEGLMAGTTGAAIAAHLCVEASPGTFKLWIECVKLEKEGSFTPGWDVIV